MERPKITMFIVKELFASPLFEFVEELDADVAVVIPKSDRRKFICKIPFHSNYFIVRLCNVGYVSEGNIARDLLLEGNASARLPVRPGNHGIDLKLREAKNAL